MTTPCWCGKWLFLRQAQKVFHSWFLFRQSTHWDVNCFTLHCYILSMAWWNSKNNQREILYRLQGQIKGVFISGHFCKSSRYMKVCGGCLKQGWSSCSRRVLLGRNLLLMQGRVASWKDFVVIGWDFEGTQTGCKPFNTISVNRVH